MAFRRSLAALVVVAASLISACADAGGQVDGQSLTVPYQDRWGIYVLDLTTQEVAVIYSSPDMISFLDLTADGSRIVFSQRVGGGALEDEEIAVVESDGTGYRQLTDNQSLDAYGRWSPDGGEIAFLTTRDGDMDIFVMDADGTDQRQLYDSGSHDADIDWVDDQIAFTRDSQIWLMDAKGSNARQITDFDRAGEWGDANLPFGDYDPRLNPARTTIVFERLIDDSSPHGIYEIMALDLETGTETNLTGNDYSQGLANWSNAGDRLVYVVSAIGLEGQYDLYMMNSDGSGNHNITPDYFPAEFLCHRGMFSADDSAILFIGEWFQQ
jgi:Tol biopolymer transport system component